MRLYYYTAKQWGMKSLWEKRLKVARYAELNDPFELRPFAQTEKDAKLRTERVVNILSDGHGVLCFSESWQSILMWAHYADKHTGICLGFEIKDDEFLTKVEYVSDRMPSPIDIKKPNGGVSAEMIATCLTTKHSGWEYEKERRLRIALNETCDGIYYRKFDTSMKLREVIIGARSSLSIRDVSEAIGTEPEADVEIWTAQPSHGEFKMCRNR